MAYHSQVQAETHSEPRNLLQVLSTPASLPSGSRLDRIQGGSSPASKGLDLKEHFTLPLLPRAHWNRDTWTHQLTTPVAQDGSSLAGPVQRTYRVHSCQGGCDQLAQCTAARMGVSALLAQEHSRAGLGHRSSYLTQGRLEPEVPE